MNFELKTELKSVEKYLNSSATPDIFSSFFNNPVENI